MCQLYGYISMKYEAELLNCEILIEIEDYSQAMIIITKTIASLK